MGEEKIHKERSACGEKLCMPSNSTDWNLLRCEVLDDFVKECGAILQGKLAILGNVAGSAGSARSRTS